MKMKNLMIIIFTVLLALPVNASVLSIEEKEILLNETESINITLDVAPEGLSGYNITVSFLNPIEEILDVRFPDWAILHDNSTLPADSLWIKAVDLNENVQSNASNILLASLTVKGNKVGETEIDITVTKMDDDEGYPITPSTVSGKLSIIGEEIGPDKDGGGRVMIGNYQLPTPVATKTETPTPAATRIMPSTLPTSTPEETVTPTYTPEVEILPTPALSNQITIAIAAVVVAGIVVLAYVLRM